ncbi:MBL fold metallo-hydrolase [Oleiphilus messinensis]|uniref:hypothetical protein n=1 Tax=Oleiphilus messinensis TaxID=141451 RepID=UPI0018E02244|nr:hypothetical protein [Oleiphilus messinensis]
MLKLTFLGATDTVTGSKYLVETEHSTILVDCGMFQGVKNLRERNWRPLPLAVHKLDAIVVTVFINLIKPTQGLNEPIPTAQGARKAR